MLIFINMFCIFRKFYIDFFFLFKLKIWNKNKQVTLISTPLCALVQKFICNTSNYLQSIINYDWVSQVTHCNWFLAVVVCTTKSFQIWNDASGGIINFMTISFPFLSLQCLKGSDKIVNIWPFLKKNLLFFFRTSERKMNS